MRLEPATGALYIHEVRAASQPALVSGDKGYLEQLCGHKGIG